MPNCPPTRSGMRIPGSAAAAVNPISPAPFAMASLRTTASHTIGLPHLAELLNGFPRDATFEQYQAAVVEENFLGRPSEAGRQRTFRHLRELYILDADASLPFRALRELWEHDPDSLPLMAGMLAFARDEVLRVTWPFIERAKPGDLVASADLTATATESPVADGLGEGTLGKIGRNTGASWTQTGHLVGRVKKHRTQVEATPTAIAYAAYLGHLSGHRGTRLLATPWAALLDLSPSDRLAALRLAHQANLLDLKIAGDVVDVSFPNWEGSN
ncbi:MAG: hypothetical protein FWG25_05445 [Promicromonosporaceae bacterium]|nr:hypothetical protein [Promicromonosporaceae bacterium]